MKYFKNTFLLHGKTLSKITLVFALLAVLSQRVFAQVFLETEVKISDDVMFFDGNQVSINHTANNPNGYDFVYGNALTPHGDCIKTYKNFVFMTWYRGGKNDRHVMLSRYNTKTGVLKTIEFPHRHTGFDGQWWIGETHNTIGIGICPKDETIHMVYDLHRNGNIIRDNIGTEDYLRYSFSEDGAATVPDNQFTIERFVNSPAGNYKHLEFVGIDDVNTTKLLTYPAFFTNDEGDLFMKTRFGYSRNGKFMLARFDGTKWEGYTDFNRMQASSHGSADNWGLYGDYKYVNGKIRIGFQKRSSIRNDKYLYQNGIYYAYSDDPEGKTQWKDFQGTNFSSPLADAELIKIAEPGDFVQTTQKDKVFIVSGFDFTVTDAGDEHFVSMVRDDQYNVTKRLHTYRKAGNSQFTTVEYDAGGEVYNAGNDVYVIGLKNGRVNIVKTEGGESNFVEIYQHNSGPTFDKGVVYVKEGKLYYYLKQAGGSGDKRTTYLQVFDLGLAGNNDTPPAGFTFAADEGDMVNVTGTIDIAYGAIGQFNYLYNQTSDVTCSNATFGDPIPGTVKKCYVKSVSYPEIESADGAQAPNVAENLLDGLTDDDHRWSAQVYPKSVVIDYGESKNIVGTQVHTYQNRSYHYTISISDNPNSGFVEVVNQSGTAASHPIEHSFASTSGRYVKLTVTGATGYSSNWVSINELNIVEGSVTPDPVTTTLSPTEDAYLQGSTRHNNTLIRIESGNRVGYLQFDLSSINGTITDAQLKLTCDSDGGSGLITVAKGNSSNWTEDNLSTSNAPSSSGQLGSINTTYNVGSTYTWALDESSISGGGELSLILTQSGGNDAAFASKESSVPSAKLEITYIPSGGARMRSDNESAASKPKSQYLQIYPNPAKDKFTITLDGNSIETLAIYTLGGLELYQTDSIEGKIELSKGTLFTRGMYLIKAIDNQGLMYQQKLIVE
ncbi:BNR-4 repeat-containing protein [Reichenbachiella ulvae]|uniref:BNR-4 repeat-containing protein n=1 Tax=Reichenbachiella ulvae TaxID=2980104 RepID=A0ABT3CT29_9BACT|nr:BNR-4 repeat-containing protein [Reichenbachiella ulvae]MCV9386664.1 BNR-4 repeat-containing protein [Reichenbachiella ulvae]